MNMENFWKDIEAVGSIKESSLHKEIAAQQK